MKRDGKDELGELISGCLKNDRKCQQQVFKLFYSKMMAVCMRYAKDRDEAKDLLQEGFIKVFSNLENYGNNGSFEGWIRRIMVNTAIDSYRKEKRSLLDVNSEMVDRFGNEDESYDEDDNNDDYLSISPEMVMQEVQNLSPAYKAVFNLYVIEGFPHKEIAEKLGISEGSSKSNLSKAKRNLKKALSNKIVPND
jgi:RNA polymerase sigma factor (sigma-70 family)